MRDCVYFVDVDTLQNAVRRMTAELAEAMAAMGIRSKFFSPEGSLDELAADAQAGGVAAVVSFNIYTVLAPTVVELAQRHRIPLFFYNTDHPHLGYESHLQLMEAFPDLLITLTGEDELTAAQALHPDRPSFFVLRQGATRQDEASWDKRDIPHLAVGNNPIAGQFGAVTDPEELRRLAHRIPAIGELGQDRLNRMVEIHEAAPFKPMAEVLDEALAGADPPLDDQLRLLRLFDLYARTHVRARALTELLRVPALICGHGWDYLRDRNSRAHLLGSVETEKVQAFTRRARFLYNLVPPYYSCSERVLEAAILGTPVVTTPSRFFQREFGDSLTYFQAPEELAALLAHPPSENEVREKAVRARAIALERHTWDQRARAILDLLHIQPPGTAP
ncbi:MAG: glycosyltransferase [Magnetospirillum sp.]|nr:glycosyltransferase [Magnetospirillum sp.]